MKDKRVTVNMIMEMLKDKEVMHGGIFQKEDYYIKKYGFKTEEIGMIESALYMISRIEDVNDFSIDWKY